MNKNIVLFFVLLILGTLAKADNSEVRVFSDFNSVYIYGNISVRLQKSDSTYAILKGDGIDFGKVTTKISGEQLVLKYKKMGDDKTLSVVIFYKSIDELIGKAGVSIVANQLIESKDFKIKLSQGGDADLNIDMVNIDVRVTQGSNLILKGKAENIVAVVNSGADMVAYKLMAKDADLKANTGGEIYISLKGDVTVSANTSGLISYKGSPKSISQSVSTGGRITQKK